MAVRNPKCLAVDASVARASGGQDAIFPKSRLCRDFLREILSLHHSIIMTNDIQQEWDNHQSKFARSWRVQMTKRGLVKRHFGMRHGELRQSVEEAVEKTAYDRKAKQAVLEAILKDIHLIEAALLVDHTVAALDERVRRYFAESCFHVSELVNVVWANPTIPSEDCILWLRRGAPPDDHRTLGYFGVD